MGKKIAIIFTICIWIALSAFSCCFVAQKSIHEIQNAYTANYRNGYLYGIEIYENKYFIFSVNTETGEQQYFTYPVVDENGTRFLNGSCYGERWKIICLLQFVKK